MDYWLFLGLVLAGCGVGALLTAVVYLTQLRKVKADLQKASLGSQDKSSPDKSKTAPDPKDGEPQRRSA
jgi:hypothetical protein